VQKRFRRPGQQGECHPLWVFLKNLKDSAIFLRLGGGGGLGTKIGGGGVESALPGPDPRKSGGGGGEGRRGGLKNNYLEEPVQADLHRLQRGRK